MMTFSTTQTKDRLAPTQIVCIFLLFQELPY